MTNVRFTILVELDDLEIDRLKAVEKATSILVQRITDLGIEEQLEYAETTVEESSE